MIDDGLLEEAKSLIHLRKLNTLNTVGYKEVFDHIDGKCSFPEAIVEIKNHTWQYARKQLNLLKRYMRQEGWILIVAKEDCQTKKEFIAQWFDYHYNKQT